MHELQKRTLHQRSNWFIGEITDLQVTISSPVEQGAWRNVMQPHFCSGRKFSLREQNFKLRNPTLVCSIGLNLLIDP